MLEKPVKAWICAICGYIHYGDTPPDECPICGATYDFFEPYEEKQQWPAEEPATAAAGRKYVIVGAGIAGISAAEAIRRTDSQGEITLLSNEAGLPYWRMNLTRFLAGDIGADLLDLHPAEWYTEQRIRLDARPEAQVTRLDLAAKTLTIQSGETIEYDRLVLAVGSHPFVPPVPGSELRNVTTLRTRADAQFLLEQCAGSPGPVVIIGGGILGLETAGGLARFAPVTVIENQAWLLSRQLNAAAGQVMANYLKTLNIQVVANAKVCELVGEGAARAVALESPPGEPPGLIPAGLVVISAGVRSNLALAKQAGLEVKLGILVDDSMRTSNADVFAAGDAVEFNGVLYGTWAPAQSQGAVAGASAAGADAFFVPLARAHTLKVLGIELFSIGRVQPQSAEDVLVEHVGDLSYTGYLFKSGRLVGAILLGGASLAVKVKRAVESGKEYTGTLDVDCVNDWLELPDEG